MGVGIRAVDHGLAVSVAHPAQVGRRSCEEGVACVDEERFSTAETASEGSGLICESCGQHFPGVSLALPAACARCGGALGPVGEAVAAPPVKNLEYVELPGVDPRAEPPTASPLEALAEALDEALGSPEVVEIVAEPTAPVPVTDPQ